MTDNQRHDGDGAEEYLTGAVVLSLDLTPAQGCLLRSHVGHLLRVHTSPVQEGYRR